MGAVGRYRRHGWVVAASLGSLSSSGCGVDPPGFAGGPPVDSGAPGARPPDGSEASGVAPPPLNVRLDSSFGLEGNVGGALADWSPVGVALDAQGRLVVSGPGGDPAAPVSEVVRRFTPDGALDVAFGASGKVTFALSPDTWGQAVRVLPGGGIGVLGAASLDGDEGSFAVRMNADGATFAGSLLLTAVTGPFSAEIRASLRALAWYPGRHGACVREPSLKSPRRDAGTTRRVAIRLPRGHRSHDGRHPGRTH